MSPSGSRSFVLFLALFVVLAPGGEKGLHLGLELRVVTEIEDSAIFRGNNLR